MNEDHGAWLLHPILLVLAVASVFFLRLLPHREGDGMNEDHGAWLLHPILLVLAVASVFFLVIGIVLGYGWGRLHG